jgi:hypothetical protein
VDLLADSDKTAEIFLNWAEPPKRGRGGVRLSTNLTITGRGVADYVGNSCRRSTWSTWTPLRTGPRTGRCCSSTTSQPSDAPDVGRRRSFRTKWSSRLAPSSESSTTGAGAGSRHLRGRNVQRGENEGSRPNCPELDKEKLYVGQPGSTG